MHRKNNKKKKCKQRSGKIVTDSVRVNVNDPPTHHFIEMTREFLEDIAYSAN